MVSTHPFEKYAKVKIGSFPQGSGVKITNISNHHLGKLGISPWTNQKIDKRDLTLKDPFHTTRMTPMAWDGLVKDQLGPWNYNIASKPTIRFFWGSSKNSSNFKVSGFLGYQMYQVSGQMESYISPSPRFPWNEVSHFPEIKQVLGWKLVWSRDNLTS